MVVSVATGRAFLLLSTQGDKVAVNREAANH